MNEIAGLIRIARLAGIIADSGRMKIYCMNNHKLKEYSQTCPRCGEHVGFLNPKNDAQYFFSLMPKIQGAMLLMALRGVTAEALRDNMKAQKSKKTSIKWNFHAMRFAQEFVNTKEFREAPEMVDIIKRAEDGN